MSDGFDSDDPFAGFTAEDFEIIEHEAIAATQGVQRAAPYKPPSRPPYKPPVPDRQQQPQNQQQQQQTPALPPPQPQKQSSFNRATSFQNPFPIEDPPEDDYNQFNVSDEDLILIDTEEIPLHSQSLPPVPSPARSALHQELAFLRAETARLKAERDKFETLAFSNDGRMDHLQRTLSKVKLDHESTLQKLRNTAETEKRGLMNEVAERERKLAALTADIAFQRNELREAREMASRSVAVSRSVTGNGEMVSPRKAARVVKGSGIKSPESKSKIGVFSARAFGRDESIMAAKTKKRKREEPIITPEPVGVENTVLSESEINKIVMERVLRERSTWTVSDERFELMRDILAHRMEDGTETFSMLATMTYKTEEHAISSILIHEITTQAGNAADADALGDIICEILSEQWSRCLKEEVYHPLEYIQGILNSLLLQCYSTCKHCLTFTPSPIHLSQTTVELHASKRIYNKEIPQLPFIAVTSSLDLLYTIACGLPLPADIAKFWEISTVNFTVMTLHTKQLVATIEGMSRLLETSITKDGFGPRGEFEDDGVQRDPVALVLDKLSLNLVQEPRAGSTREELWQLRQTIVQTMSELVAGHAKGSKILHDSGYVLPRLIGLLANEIEFYYAHPLESEQSIALSKSCVRLLHSVIMPHSPDTLSHYLSPFPGAQQAHNVAMTRLSFGGESETVFTDVSDMARDLLEAAVSPEEGDGIWSLFQWGDEMDDDEVGEDLSAFMD